MNKYIIFGLSALMLGANGAFAQSEATTSGQLEKTVKAVKRYPSRKVKGCVVDAATKLPVAGALVSVGEIQGYSVLTNSKGEYTLDVPLVASSLLVTAPDYNVTKIGLVNDEVQKKASLYSTVFAAEYSEDNNVTAMQKATGFQYSNASSIEEEVQKRLGAQVRTVARNGNPGVGGVMFMNGLNSLNVNAQPLIVVDGVFSMEGDLCNLPEIVRLKHKYNASIMVDEAHGLGVFGKQGRGVCDHFGLTDEVDLIMGTFSKSLASIGGFIAANQTIIDSLRHTARTYIFSASCTPAATAAAREALHIIKTEPERIEALWDVTNYALKRFREEGFEIGETESPIIPLYVRDLQKTFIVVARAFEEGVFINPVIPPACAPSDTLVRYALMATHTHEQVDKSVVKLKKVFHELGIL